MNSAKMKRYHAIKSGASGVKQYLKSLEIEKPKHEPIQPIILKISVPC